MKPYDPYYPVEAIWEAVARCRTFFNDDDETFVLYTGIKICQLTTTHTYVLVPSNTRRRLQDIHGPHARTLLKAFRARNTS